MGLCHIPRGHDCGGEWLCVVRVFQLSRVQNQEYVLKRIIHHLVWYVSKTF